MGSAEQFDPIAAIEAAYRFDDGLDPWLDAIARAARPDLDCGLGVQAVLCDLEAPVPVPMGIGLDGTPPAMHTYLRRVVYDAPPDTLGKILNSPTRLYSYSELSSVLGHEDFFLDHPIPGVAPFRDWLAVVSREPGATLMLGGFSKRRVRPSPRARRRWQRIAIHLSAAVRLVMRLRRLQPPAADAVLSPDGRCLHAQGVARRSEARERLREAALRIDAARGPLRRSDPEEALELWRGLVAGRWSLVDRFESDGRRFVVALRNDSPYRDPRALTTRQSQVAHLVTLGLSNKEIGYALGLSESAIGTHVGAALRKLRLRRREELAAEAAREARVSYDRLGDSDLAVASRAHVRLPASAGLSSAEEEVVRAALRGQTDAQIARDRGRSPRTVANQLRSAFRKLDVRSRAELAAKVSSMETR